MPKFSVERSTVINAPRGQVYATVRDFRQWPTWSPWLVCEPACQLSFDEDTRGYSWNGEIVGEGKIRITEESEPDSIRYQLEFLKPWKSTADVQFRFEEENGQTEVTWSMHSSLPFFLFFLKGMMTGMIRMDYDRGLLMLKDLVETDEIPTFTELLGPQSFEGLAYVGVRSQCNMSEVGMSMERDFKDLIAKMEQANLEPSAKPFSIYHQWNLGKASVDYTIGVPVAETPADLPLNVISDRLPDCEAFVLKHTGAYRHLGNPWSIGYAHARAKKFAINKQIPPFETYENDPANVDETELVTHVHFPIKS